MINVAVIGVGGIAPAHIKAYLALGEHYNLVAFSDINKDKAEKTAAEYQLQVDVVDDYQLLLERGDIDLVSICTPPYTHAELSIACLKAGKHVMVEKPMASSLEECDAMNEAAAESGKILSVVAQNRFRSPLMKLRAVLESGIIGPVVHTQVDSHWWRGYSYYDLWWRGTWEKEGGGCTLNHAVHHIDIFKWLNGMPAEVTAVMSNTSHDNAEVEDLSIAICTYDNGSLAQITSSVVHHGQEQQLIFQGKRARVSVPWKIKTHTAMANGFPEDNQTLEREIQQLYEAQHDLQYEGHMGQIHDMALAIRGEKPILASGIDGRQTLELITAIYQSASTKQPVKLPLQKDSLFYSRQGMLEHAIHFYEKKNSVMDFEVNDISINELK